MDRNVGVAAWFFLLVSVSACGSSKPGEGATRTSTRASVDMSHQLLAFGFEGEPEDIGFDRSGNQIRGAVRGGARVAEGRGGQVLQCDGLDDHIWIGHTSLLDFQDYTTMAWVRPQCQGYDSERMSVLDKADTYSMNVRRESRVLRCEGRFGPAGKEETRFVESPAPLSFGTWTHVACSYSGQELRLFIDGGLAGTTVVPPGLEPTDEDVIVGAKRNAAGNVEAQWCGQVDDVRVFREALDESAIATLMSQPVHN